VTEFLLTPRDCLCGNKLTVRRTKLKGDGVKTSYRVADDYYENEYEISNVLAGELRGYIAATEKQPPTHMDTLLRIPPHYKYLHAVNGTRNRYYTYFNLNTCFRSFIAEERGGLDISHIHLGDTRHLAMVSLILSGGSPTICRELAGHANIDVSSHYYTNISTIVECATLRRLRKAKDGTEALITGEQKFSLAKPENSHRVDGGYCDSTAYARRDISDCLKIISADGAIGDCSVCRHYFPDNEGLRLNFTDTDAAKAAVDADSRYLMQMIDLVRKGMGHSEDIGTALLRLQHSAYNYSMRIKEKMDYGAT
jgi:hypothetical protein